MNQQFPPRHARLNGHGHIKEQRPSDYAPDSGQRAQDEHAGVVARGIIRETGVEDTTQIWRALKRAYLAGYADATR